MKKTNRIFNKSAQAGFTVIELMISTAVLGIITSIIASFLTSSLKLNELNVARGELRSNISLAIELLTTEIYSAGSIGVSADDTEETCDAEYVNSATNPAFSLESATERLYEFTVRYCDPYEKVGDQRVALEVSYKIEADSDNGNLLTLKRKKNKLVGNSFETNSYVSMVPGIVGLELEFECKFNTDCNPLNGGDYNEILAVTVKIAAQTTFETKEADQETYYFSLDNSEPLDATEGYLYDYAEQTVRPVNLAKTVLP